MTLGMSQVSWQRKTSTLYSTSASVNSLMLGLRLEAFHEKIVSGLGGPKVGVVVVVLILNAL